MRLKSSLSICVLLALGLHALLGALLFLHFTPKTQPVGKKTWVQAYVYQYHPKHLSKINQINSNLKSESQHRLSKQHLKLKQHQKLKIKKIQKSKKNKQCALSKPRHSNSQITHGTSQKLLEILHDLIAKQQRYPQNAMMLDRTGKVTVSFVLWPNGSIHALKLLKSSGFSSLDTAALVTIKAIAPVHQAHFYLHSAKKFKIAIVFR